jgi:predicted permease
LAVFSATQVIHFRLAMILTILIGGACRRLHSKQPIWIAGALRKKAMAIVLVCLDCPIALFVIWPMQLSGQLIWLPIIALLLMLIITALSAATFYHFEPDKPKRLTLILATGFSNTGYTSGAFVCYVLFGLAGLALANLYVLFSLPTFYLIYLPTLKARQLHTEERKAGPFDVMLDLRMLPIPVIITAIILSLADVKSPAFITRLYIIDVLVYVASSLSFLQSACA